MIYSFILVLVLGYLSGLLFEKIKLPKIIGMILIGVVLGYFCILDESFLNISSYLRKIALIIILTRAGLSIDIKKLKEFGLPAILMCFVPAVFEITGTVIFAPLLLKIDYLEALLLGCVLAAVSPAIIVPRMIKFKEEYNSDMPNLMLAGASLDDIFVITAFYSVLGIFTNESLNILSIPISISLGILIGVSIGFIIKLLYSKFNINNIAIVLSTFLISILLTLLESVFEFNSLISIILIGVFLIKHKDVEKIKNNYNKLWFIFEIFLFVLVGVFVNLEVAFAQGLSAFFLLIIILFFRSLGVFVCLVGSNAEKKEKFFCILSYLPKATVQASIGAIALENNLEIGPLTLTISALSILMTASIGSVLIDKFTPKLLT